MRSLTEEILEILPADVVWKLGVVVSAVFFELITHRKRVQTLAM